jgi:hypothetical protein
MHDFTDTALLLSCQAHGVGDDDVVVTRMPDGQLHRYSTREASGGCRPSQNARPDVVDQSAPIA